jgi:hypothetical protein
MRITVRTECRRLTVFVRNNLRPRLVHTDPLELVGNTKLFKKWQIER